MAGVKAGEPTRTSADVVASGASTGIALSAVAEMPKGGEGGQKG